MPSLKLIAKYGGVQLLVLVFSCKITQLGEDKMLTLKDR